jgi:hypothetical protein
MTPQTESFFPLDGGCLPSDEAITDPLAAILRDNRAEAVLCHRLAAIVNDMFAAETREHAEAVLRFLTDRFPVHEANRSDFLPLLAQRCLQEDEVDEIVERLHAERKAGVELIGKLRPEIAALAAGRAVVRPLEFIFHALSFIETQERQIAWNARVLLPLAVERLRPADLLWLGAKRAERRSAPLV